MTSLSTTTSPGRVSLSSLWTLYKLTIRQHRHGRRWIAVALMMLLPAILVTVSRITSPDVPTAQLEFIYVFLLIPQAILPLLALIYASAMVQDEVEDQTITYLLIRPIPKDLLYAVKLLATITTTVALTIVLSVMTYAAIYIATPAPLAQTIHRCLVAASVHSLAALAYCCIFGLISIYTRRTLVVGILYIALFEGLFANLDFGIRLITVIYYARLIAYRFLPFVVPTPMGDDDVAADLWQLDIKNDPKLLEHPSVSTCFMVLSIGSIVFAIIAAWLCTRREFHVKTPEKA